MAAGTGHREEPRHSSSDGDDGRAAENDKQAKRVSRLCSSHMVHASREPTNHRQGCVRQGGARGFELPVRNSVHTELHVWILQAQILFIVVQRIKPLIRLDLKATY